MCASLLRNSEAGKIWIAARWVKFIQFWTFFEQFVVFLTVLEVWLVL